jgi:hypothetical protein
MGLEHCLQAYILKSNPEAESKLTGEDMGLWKLPACPLRYNSSNKSIPPNIYFQSFKPVNILFKYIRLQEPLSSILQHPVKVCPRDLVSFQGTFLGQPHGLCTLATHKSLDMCKRKELEEEGRTPGYMICAFYTAKTFPPWLNWHKPPQLRPTWS